MRAEDLKKLSPKQIQERFQIPSLPTQISKVKVPKGTRVRIGAVQPGRNGRGGDVIQFEIREKNLDIKWYSETEGLQSWLMKNST